VDNILGDADEDYLAVLGYQGFMAYVYLADHILNPAPQVGLRRRYERFGDGVGCRAYCTYAFAGMKPHIGTRPLRAAR
jgi:hypothetical protein